METADVIVAIGGDTGNTVPRYDVTPAEVAVLREVHGDEAVFDIAPKGVVDRTHRAERERLIEKYGRQHEGQFKASAVERLFPGAAARVFETFAELDLPEDFYKAQTRVSASVAPAKPAKTKKEPAKVEAPVVEAEPEDDGIEDMDPALFS